MEEKWLLSAWWLQHLCPGRRGFPFCPDFYQQGYREAPLTLDSHRDAGALKVAAQEDHE